MSWGLGCSSIWSVTPTLVLSQRSTVCTYDCRWLALPGVVMLGLYLLVFYERLGFVLRVRLGITFMCPSPVATSLQSWPGHPPVQVCFTALSSKTFLRISASCTSNTLVRTCQSAIKSDVMMKSSVFICWTLLRRQGSSVGPMWSHSSCQLTSCHLLGCKVQVRM